MPDFFPSDDITGIPRARFYAAPLDYKAITDSFEFQDGGKTFNESGVPANAPRKWEYAYTCLDPDQAVQFDDFFNAVRYSQVFYFRDKYGVVWDNVRIEDYQRTHDAHKSWCVNVFFTLVGFGSQPVIITPLDVPTGFVAISVTSTSVTLDWDTPPEDVVFGGVPVVFGGVDVIYSA
jgi:hypothetical protein